MKGHNKFYILCNGIEWQYISVINCFLCACIWPSPCYCASVTQSTCQQEKAAKLSGQLTWTWQQAGPHCLGQLMTSWAIGKDIGKDSPFHVGLHAWDTKQLINLNLKLPSHVVRQCQSGAWNVACTSSRKAQYCTLCLQRISYPMSIYEIKLFYIIWIFVDISKK